MTLEHGYFVSQIIAAAVLVASILFLAVQVRQNTKIVNQTMNEDMRGHQNVLFDEIARNRDFAEFHMRIATEIDSLDDIDRYRATFVARKGVRMIVHGIEAKLSGTISDVQWKEVQDSIQLASDRIHVRIEWERVKHLYSKRVHDIWDQYSLPG